MGVSDPDPLSFADAPSRHPVDVAHPAGGNGITTAFEIQAGGKAAEEVRGSGCYLTTAGLWGREAEGCFRRVQAAAGRAGRRWVIGRGLRLAVMKCDESLESRQAFADAVSAGIAKGLSEGLRHGLEHGLKGLEVSIGGSTGRPEGRANGCDHGCPVLRE
nr:hypothetical protein [Tanacetum cinerariifolium]